MEPLWTIIEYKILLNQRCELSINNFYVNVCCAALVHMF